MKGQVELIEGTTRDHSKSQFFTPPKLARKLVEWALAGYWAGDESWHRSDRKLPAPRVLEPSAGNGAIVRPLVAAGAEVTAVELDERYVTELIGAGAMSFAMGKDFLSLHPVTYFLQPFDLVCGNFPFHRDLKGEFTLHALDFAPRTCAIYPANFFYSEQREKLWTQVRPTRIAHIAKRPWPGATDYVALELVDRMFDDPKPPRVTVEWWFEDWS